MRPSTTSLIAAFLALGGLELVTAENTQELKPRFIPKNYKRHITYGTSRAVASESNLSSRQLINSVDSLLENLLGQDTSSSSTSSSAPAASESPVVVVPITLSVDANGVTHTITGTPITTMTNAAQTVAGSASTTETAASTTTASSAAGSTATQSASSTGDLLSSVGDTVSSVVSDVGDTVSSVGSAVGDIVSSVVGSSASTPIPTSTAGDSSSSVSGSSSTQPSSADATTTPTTGSSDLLSGLISDLLPTASTASVSGNTTATQSTIPVSVPAITLAANASSVLFPGGLTGSVIPTPAATSAALIPTAPVGSSVIGSSSAIPTIHATSTSAPSTTQTTSSTTQSQSSTTTEVTPTPEPTSDNNDWVPSTILVEPPSTTQETSSHETATGTSTPVELPGSISPAGGAVSPPVDSTLIQIGFNGKLRYSFVATTPLSSSQIFLYVPQGLQYALQVIGQDITMDAIQPYDNSASTGYIATVALAYIPSDTVETLSELLHNPNSRLYEQPNESVKALFSMIDPSIPLLVGESGSSSGSSSSGSGDSNGSGNNGDSSGSTSNNNSDAGAGSSSSTKASSVGIGVGVVAGAAAYGAGMFWLARRYRKKRQLHQRTGSNVDQMSEGRGSIFTAGGRNSQVSRGSGRMISAPVMAENSLGWN